MSSKVNTRIIVIGRKSSLMLCVSHYSLWSGLHLWWNFFSLFSSMAETDAHAGWSEVSTLREFSYLKPFVICEEAETYEGVAHEEPVYELLYYVDERVEWTVGQPRQCGTVLHQCLRLKQTQPPEHALFN